MNMLVNATPQQTMTSKQIAAVVDKRHDNVKRIIETLADQAVIVRPQIEDEQFKDSMGRNRTESVYVINERDSYVIVAQLCPADTSGLFGVREAAKDLKIRQSDLVEILFQHSWANRALVRTQCGSLAVMLLIVVFVWGVV